MVALSHRRDRSVGGLAEALRQSTWELHLRAERSGAMGDLAVGRIKPRAYLLLAFNLLPVYRTLETRLAQHVYLPALAEIVWPELKRTEALARDVKAMAARFPETPLRLLDESEAYRRRIEAVAREQPERLLAHAYVRYLGDLSGGQILARMLARTPGIGPEAVQFYVFPGLDNLSRAKAEYRRAIDRSGRRLVEFEGIVEEAREAFRRNIALAEAVASTSR